MTVKNPNEVRSYIVFRDKEKGLEVKPSHWVMGYTPSHQPTPLAAVDFAIKEAETKMAEAQAAVVELYNLRQQVVDKEWEPLP
jgi:hypothetical protein